MTYLERLTELRKTHSYKEAILIQGGKCTEEDIKRVWKIYEDLNDIIHDLDIEVEAHDYCHSSNWVSGDCMGIVKYLVDEKISARELELMMEVCV